VRSFFHWFTQETTCLLCGIIDSFFGWVVADAFLELNKAVNVPQPPVAVPQETVTLSLSQVSEVPEANVANVLSEIVRESTLPQTTPLKRDAPERNKENHTPPCLDEEPAKKRRRLEDPSDSGDKTAEKPALCKNLFSFLR